jgi:UDP-glucose 4-epimerase
MKILIVGGTGFIGYHLAKQCLKKNWNVSSISTKKPIRNKFLKKVKYLICDITKKQKLKKISKSNYDYVVNLGGHVNHTHKKKVFDSHFKGCKNLADIFLKKKILAFVQIGSGAEYGKKKSPQKENSICNPDSIYGKSKLLATMYLIKLFKEEKFPVTVLRVYQAYGPQQDFNRFIPIVIKSCLKDSKFPCSKGAQFRDFTYITDVVEGIIAALESKDSKGKIINIGSGKPKKIKTIIENIKEKLSGGKPQYGLIKLRKDEILNVFPDLYNSKKVLKWKSKISFKKGLNITINSLKKGLQK